MQRHYGIFLIATFFIPFLIFIQQKGYTTIQSDTNTPLTLPSAQTPGKLNVILLTYMRSGSTVIGKIFKSSPDVFYLYEPLRALHEKVQIGTIKTYDTLKRPAFIAKSKKWVKDLLNCSFENNLLARNTTSNLASVSDLISSSSFTFSRHQIIRSKKRLDIEARRCQSAKLRVMKTIRITNLQNIWQEIESDPNTKIIHLLRDPRAVQNSRLRINSHLGPRLICDWPIQTIEFSRKMQLTARGRYKEVIFENFVDDPVSKMRNVFELLGIELSISSEYLIKSLTQSSDKLHGGFSAQKRNATLVAKSWETSLDEKNRAWIEDDPTCKKLLEHIWKNEKL